MNVFILNTGRCGSSTFIKACSHIDNFTAGHETRPGIVRDSHFKYPDNHIEADNRLSWFLGRLEEVYGNDAYFVHLTRDINKTALSFLKRFNVGIINAYAKQIYIGNKRENTQLDVCLDYVKTVNSNIECFLKNKTYKMKFSLENAKNDFKIFWNWIGAKGDYYSAEEEWNNLYNKSNGKYGTFSYLYYIKNIQKNNFYIKKMKRILKNLPEFIKNV